MGSVAFVVRRPSLMDNCRLQAHSQSFTLIPLGTYELRTPLDSPKYRKRRPCTSLTRRAPILDSSQVLSTFLRYPAFPRFLVVYWRSCCWYSLPNGVRNPVDVLAATDHRARILPVGFCGLLRSCSSPRACSLLTAGFYTYLCIVLMHPSLRSNFWKPNF